ncbi:hypothetical protein, partial [Klebsiella pneumoniae]|uniref:hypothetical protein n=1 Tax=Klebsiella pneumoniae TaxID=573 RepID=UPI0025A07E54
EVSVVLSESELEALVQTGVSVEVWRGPDGQTATELAAAQQQAGYAVWRPFDGPDGLRQHVHALADRFPDLVSLQVLGASVRGREILAIKVT